MQCELLQQLILLLLTKTFSFLYGEHYLLFQLFVTLVGRQIKPIETEREKKQSSQNWETVGVEANQQYDITL